MQKNEICFDEEEDIILPDTVLGEVVYVMFFVVDILKDSRCRCEKFVKLKRQISFFCRWVKNR